MAKNYTESEIENNKTVRLENRTSEDPIQMAKYRLLNFIMEKIDNGSNIDYIVRLSEVYRNIK